MNKMIRYQLLFLSFMLFTGLFAFAQPKQVIRLSGLVVQGNTDDGLVGAHIYIPSVGRGCVSNYFGYFSMPVLAGDSVVVSSIGFKSQSFVIPSNLREPAYSLLVDLQADTTMLPTVTIYPFPSEEVFKAAFLALELPDDELAHLEKTMNHNLLLSMMHAMPTSSAVNYHQLMSQQFNAYHTRNAHATITLLDPFRWRRLIKSIKNGDFKEKDYLKND